MSQANREPEYRRRIREKAEKDQHEAETKRQKAADRWEIAGVVGLWLAAAVGVAAIWTGTTGLRKAARRPARPT
jgi:hypothetical protein